MSSFQVVSGDEDIQMDRSVMMKIKKKNEQIIDTTYY